MDDGVGNAAMDEYDNYEVKKRELARPHSRVGDLYVSRKSSFQAQLKRAHKLLFIVGMESIVVHGAGAATTMAVEVALELQRRYAGAVEVGATTSSVPVVDDLVPTPAYWQAHPEALPTVRSGYVSAMHVLVRRVKPLLGSPEDAVVRDD